MEAKGTLLVTKLNAMPLSVLLDENKKAVRVFADPNPKGVHVGDIFLGKVENIVKSLNASFVCCLPDMRGYFKHTSSKITVKQGDTILVQVQKEAIKSKIPVLSSSVELTGKYVVLTTDCRELRFSGKFKNTDKKKKLQHAFHQEPQKEVGFIIRTNADGAEIEEIEKEMKTLSSMWQRIQQEAATAAPCSRVRKAPASWLSAVRDGYDFLIGQILTDDPGLHEEIAAYLRDYQPQDLPKLSLYESGSMSLADVFRIRHQLRGALQKKVWLNSGAYLVIEPTEALVAIDVNTGKHISGSNTEEEFLKINLEASREIARQIMLRNLSGVIIIDFINMQTDASKKILLDYLKSQLQFDPVPSNIVDMTKLNLVEMTRKKICKPLYELIDITLLQ